MSRQPGRLRMPCRYTLLLVVLLAVYSSLLVAQVHLFKSDFSSETLVSHVATSLSFNPQAENIAQDSLSLLMAQVQKVPRPIPDDIIDPVVEEARCYHYGEFFHHDPQRIKRRRIFAGGLIADDSWHAIGANALETFGVYHSVTFIESNRTQSGEPRKLRFTPGSKDLRILRDIWGPNTNVYVENYVYEGELPRMAREHLMRAEILHKWKELGMERDDLGLIFDVDEIPSRDFLRTTQICEPLQNWDSSVNQTCRSPIMRISIPMFEASPKCIHSSAESEDHFARFNSLAIIIGACIEGIGDSIKHPKIPRSFQSTNGEQYGKRMKGYGEDYDYSNIPNGREGYYPLYNSADFRNMQSGPGMYGGMGFHLHNFFVSTDSLRFKHLTYGHEHKHAYQVPLGAMNADLNVLVKCAHNISDEGNRKRRLDNGLALLAEYFALPIAFKIDGYVDARHQEMIKLLLEDEREYGRADKFDGHSLYKKESMLTHLGRQHREKGTDSFT